MYSNIENKHILQFNGTTFRYVGFVYPVKVEHIANGDWQSSAGDSAQHSQAEDEEDLGEKMQGATVARDRRPAAEMPSFIQFNSNSGHITY